MNNDKDVDRLAGVPDRTLAMTYANAVRQTINATYVDFTSECLDDIEYEVAFVVPRSDLKKSKAIVAVPDTWKISVIPYQSVYDWNCVVVKYNLIVETEDGYFLPYMNEKPVFDETHFDDFYQVEEQE